MSYAGNPGPKFRPADLRRWIKSLAYAGDEVVRRAASSSAPETFDQDLTDVREFLTNVANTLERRARR